MGKLKTIGASYYRAFLLPLFFFLLAFLLYSRTLSYHYILDDKIYTYQNSFVQKGIAAFPDIITNESLKGYNVDHYPDYRPVTLLSFALEKSIFGNNPQVSHF